MAKWGFLTNHARALRLIADHPDARLRDLAAELDITERTAYVIVADLTEAGYVVKEKDGRRNRYQIQRHSPLPERGLLLTDAKQREQGRAPSTDA